MNKKTVLKETKEHIENVKRLSSDFCSILSIQISDHDQSKLQDPELEGFVNVSKKLKDLTYGSEEYKKCLIELKPTLDHHYKNNRHHPEFHTNGVNSMNLIDLIEMFIDWKAATLRHSDGSLARSIEINKERFNLSPQLVDIFNNTAEKMNW